MVVRPLGQHLAVLSVPGYNSRRSPFFGGPSGDSSSGDFPTCGPMLCPCRARRTGRNGVHFDPRLGFRRDNGVERSVSTVVPTDSARAERSGEASRRLAPVRGTDSAESPRERSPGSGARRERTAHARLRSVPGRSPHRLAFVRGGLLLEGAGEHRRHGREFFRRRAARDDSNARRDPVTAVLALAHAVSRVWMPPPRGRAKAASVANR